MAILVVRLLSHFLIKEPHTSCAVFMLMYRFANEGPPYSFR